LYKIDRILEEKTVQEIQEDQDYQAQVESKLPSQYREFADVFSKEAANKLPLHRLYDHKIELEDSPDTLGFCLLCRQSTEELLATKKYIIEHLSKGFIESSQVPFAAPILFVRKANGALQLCIDFRKLNSLTCKDRYPLPLIDETLAQLGKAKVFTKLNIQQAFHRICIDPASEDLTTFRTRYSCYKYRVVLFGLTNGPATYQRYMNNVLFDYLDDFCTAYLDNILIYSSDELEHQEHVCKVLTRLREAGLQVDIRKSEFHVTQTKYLGFIVSTDSIETDPEKTAVIDQWEPPRTVKGIQSFLGFCNFYRRFIRDYRRIAKPLNRLVRKDQPFLFDKVCLDAFQELKNRLVSIPLLVHFNPDLPKRMETDTSDGVIAGVLLQQEKDLQWHPVAFYSKTMIEAELNYPIHDKEMLAIVSGFLHWRIELEGIYNRIEVVSDYKALEYFITTKALTARQACWAEVLSRYYFRIVYKPGATNRADAITRREQDTDTQRSATAVLQIQTMLQPEQLDP
jgi:hypothetical protein